MAKAIPNYSLLHSILISMQRIFARLILISLSGFSALFLSFGVPATVPRAQAVQRALPRIEGTNQNGFGGFITKVTPCICDTIGMLITITGPFGGDFIYSFSKPPKIKVGQFFLVGGPVLGGAGGDGSCGTDIDDGDCEDQKKGKVITILGGIL